MCHMRVRSDIGYAILGGIGVLSIIGLLGATWVYANFNSIMHDQVMQAELVRLQGAAKVYHRRLDTYQGVCRDIGVPLHYSCNENNDAFAVSVAKENGSFYCIDSTGHFGEQVLPIRDAHQCSRNVVEPDT